MPYHLGGGEADYNMVLGDGVQVNDAGGAYDFSDLTTDNIERIEIIRGPQSALYGSNAIGSVIQIFTRRGQGTPQGNLSLSGGNFNTFEGHGGVTGGIERFGGSLGVGYVSTSGFLPINNAYTNFTISSGLDYQPIEALKLAFSARFTDSFFEIPMEGAGDRLTPLDPDQFSERQRLILSLQTTHAITPPGGSRSCCWGIIASTFNSLTTITVRPTQCPDLSFLGWQVRTRHSKMSGRCEACGCSSRLTTCWIRTMSRCTAFRNPDSMCGAV
jgi:outer membrane receptor protein involved in Fe transport